MDGFALTMCIVGAIVGIINAVAQIDHRHAVATTVPPPVVIVPPPTTDGAAVAPDAASGETTPRKALNTPRSADAIRHLPSSSSLQIAALTGHPGRLNAVYPVYAPWDEPAYQQHYVNRANAGKVDTVWSFITARSIWTAPAVLYWIAIFIVQGTARIYVNSTGLAIKALRPAPAYSADDNAALTRTVIVVFSVCNWAGRFAGGIINDRLSRLGISRVHMSVVAAALVIVASFSLAYGPVEQSAVAPVLAAIIGVGDGFAFVTWPVWALDTFGRARYGRAFSFFISAIGLGSLGFNGLSTAVYHEFGSESGGKWTCFGTSCVRNTWIIGGSLTCLALVLLIALLHVLYHGALVAPPLAIRGLLHPSTPRRRTRRLGAAAAAGNGGWR